MNKPAAIYARVSSDRQEESHTICANSNATSEAYGFAAVAKSQHEQPRAPILAALRVAHHRATAVIALSFLSRRGEHDPHGLWRLRPSAIPYGPACLLRVAG
jgi:hypothetical protein